MGELTDKMKGKVKETAGVVTGNRKLEAEGKADTFKGHVKEKVEDAKRIIKDNEDEEFDRPSRREEP